MVDFVIAVSLDLPRALYDSAAMTAFSLITGIIALWLQRQLAKGVTSATVAAAFSAVLFVFTVADVAIGVALAPRYAAAPPDAIYGNNLAQQITSTFDVVVCVLSLTVLAALLFTGPLAGYLLRRATKPAKAGPVLAPAVTAPVPSPSDWAPPTIVRQPRPAAAPKIARRLDDSTTVLPAPPTTELQVPTTALRIQRQPPKT